MMTRAPPRSILEHTSQAFQVALGYAMLGWVVLCPVLPSQAIKCGWNPSVHKERIQNLSVQKTAKQT